MSLLTCKKYNHKMVLNKKLVKFYYVVKETHYLTSSIHDVINSLIVYFLIHCLNL